MALQTKTITGSTNNSNWTWKMDVIENSTDINSNTSSVTINTYLGRASSSSYFGGNATVSINCNGEARSYSKTFSYPTNVGAGGWVLAQSETFSVKHNDNGTKDINVSSSMSTSDFTPSYSSASGNVTLTTIPRASSVSGGSGNIGSSTTISISRASGSFTHTLEYAFGNLSGTIATGVGTSYKWTIPTSFYAQIPNSNSGTGTITCKTYSGGTLVGTSSVVFTAKVTNSNPIIGTFTYKDSNSSTTAITENNQRIIRNNSNLLFSVGTATAKNSASISKYEVTFNGLTKSRTSTGTVDFGTVNVANNLSATLKVTDSRGLTATKTITVTIDNWELPNALISLNRKNNFYSETYLKVDGTYSSLNGKNDMTIKYQYKKVSDSSYSSLTTINDNVQVTLDLDNENQWNVRVQVNDKLGTATYNLVLDRGMPIAYFDRLNSAVGINAIPKDGEALKVAKGDINFEGAITTSDVKCKNLFNKNNAITDIRTAKGFDISSLEIGKTYTFSSNLPIKSFKISDYSSGYNSVAKDEENGFTTFTFTMDKSSNITSGDKQYLFLGITDVLIWVKDISELDGYDIQIEEGTTATEYTPNKAFGIESGSNSNGSWVKFDDGTLLMDGSKTITVTQDVFSNLGNSGFVYYEPTNITLPMTSTINVIPNINVRSANFDWVSRVYGNTSDISYGIVSNSNQARNIIITWSVKGKWK